MSTRVSIKTLTRLQDLDEAVASATPEPCPIDEIISDAGTQTRVSIDPGVVNEYHAILGDCPATQHPFPPIVVFSEGGKRFLADGFHRFEAYLRSDRDDILAKVVPGSFSDAITWAARANHKHGVRRSRQDTERCILAILQDPSWKGASIRDIAEITNLNREYVRVTRNKLRMAASKPASPQQHRNDTAIAPQCHRNDTAMPPQDGVEVLGLDDLDQPITEEKVMRAFEKGLDIRNQMRAVAKIKQWASDLDKAKHAAQTPDEAYTFLHANTLAQTLQDAYAILRFAVPYATCPHCNQKGCDACQHCGWMPKTVHGQTPQASG